MQKQDSRQFQAAANSKVAGALYLLLVLPGALALDLVHFATDDATAPVDRLDVHHFDLAHDPRVLRTTRPVANEVRVESALVDGGGRTSAEALHGEEVADFRSEQGVAVTPSA